MNHGLLRDLDKSAFLDKHAGISVDVREYFA
jgi:hypothetical protein